MNTMTAQTSIIFGIVLALLLLAIGYFFLSASTTNSDIQPRTDQAASVEARTESASETGTPNDRAAASGFTLSAAQVEALVSLGVDPESVPDSISAEQETCFVATLGEERVAEIKGGAVPGGLEFMRAQSCI